MTFLPVHTIDTAPAASQTSLDGARKVFGFIPNLLGMLATSPAALRAYLGLSDAFGAGTFSDIERQVVLLTVSVEHECQYCVAAHSALASAVKLPPDVLEALRQGKPLPDPRLETLRRTTWTLVTARGWIDDDGLAAFKAAGFTEAQFLEILVGIAQKTISNYANHVAETPVDSQFGKFAWRPVHATPEGTAAK